MKAAAVLASMPALASSIWTASSVADRSATIGNGKTGCSALRATFRVRTRRAAAPSLGTTSRSFVTPYVAADGGFIVSNFSSLITDNILRVGVNYRFSGPVVAKY